MNNQKKVLIAVGLTAVAAYLLFKKNNKSVKNADGGSSLDYPSMSNQLYHAMSGWWVSDSDCVDVFKMINTQEEFDNLNKDYGVRTLSGWILNPDFTGNLKASLNNKLGLQAKQDINDWVMEFNNNEFWLNE
jgi:hypothetical protein